MIGDDFWRSMSSQAKSIDQELSHPPVFLDDRRIMLTIGWVPPLAGFMKTNVDGAHNSQSGKSARGGIVCDSNERFIKRFVCNLGSYNVLKAEMLALLHDIKLA